MSWYTVERAADAARDSEDLLLSSLALLLDRVREAPDLRARYEQERYDEVSRSVPGDDPRFNLPGELNREQTINHRLELMEFTHGPVPVMGDDAVKQAARTARAMLRRMGAGQGDELWPGQCAWSRRFGQCTVVQVRMDGGYRVRQTGMYTYPDDPTVRVARGDLKPLEGAQPRMASLEENAELLARLVLRTVPGPDGVRHAYQEARDVQTWCELLAS